MSSIKMRVVSKTMNCSVVKNQEDGNLDIMPDFQVEGTETKEIMKVDEGSVPITLINNVRENNLRKFRLKLSVLKPKEGDRIVCEVQYVVKDDTTTDTPPTV